MNIRVKLQKTKVLRALFCVSLLFLLASISMLMSPELDFAQGDLGMEHMMNIKRPDGYQKIQQINAHGDVQKAPQNQPVAMKDQPLLQVAAKQKQLYGIDYGDAQFLPRTNKERQKVVRSLLEELKVDLRVEENPWLEANSWVSRREIIPEDVPNLGSVMYAMSSLDVVKADVGYHGTQLKLTLTLYRGQLVVFKPQRATRGAVYKGIYEGPDRHNAEIVSFYLSRLLQLRRTPITIGRKLNLEEEVLPVATETLKKTFFRRGNNTCFYGRCYYCKGIETGVCGRGKYIEGAVILWLPSRINLRKYKHPWARSYKNKTVRWQIDKNYCERVRSIPPYNSSIRLLDIVDTSVFDFITGNADRHNYEALGSDPDDAVLIMDNGKGFGNPYHDESSILAPLYQCCRIRRRTWERLMKLRNGVLSQTLMSLTEDDELDPLLTFAHYEAMERRMHEIFDKVDRCIRRYGHERVLVAPMG